MSDSPDKQSLLSAFDLGPAWARGDAPEKNYEKHRGEDRPDRKGRGRPPGGRDSFGGRSGGGRGHEGRGQGGRSQGGRGQGGQGGRGQGGRGQGGRGFQERRELPAPAPGVKMSVVPAAEAIHLLGKEIHHVARVYSLFDVAEILLEARERCRLHVTSDPKRPALIQGIKGDCLFLTREEAIAHFWQSDAVEEFYEKEEVEADPPSGNFQVVARCGLSGEWLGPPNFHAYQSNLRRLHRERFSNMDFDRYASRVKTERGEEAVNAWLESMKKRVRWRPKGGSDEEWTFERATLERDFGTRFFDQAFKETRDVELPGDVPMTSLSEGVAAVIRIAGGHARRHPAMLIPATCRLLEAEHLSVFKRKGKLFCGPARPHPLAGDAVLAERPTAIVTWLDANPDSKLGDLWKAVLPADAEEPPKEWLVDLFWLLTQGHVLLFANDLLVLPKRRKGSGPKPAEVAEGEGSGKKKRRKKRRKNYRARRKSPAKLIRGITRMKPGQVKALRGRAQIWGRRLARRERISSLVEDQRGRILSRH